ncbi:alpha-tocopherol transfer protein-like [Argiope bruennichi]|uniref:alpha-tocopherol transfer protein-like n=1 Tax=Argiope bruennichi TaxID=94029 RepID=UPI002495815C|nr:alpha-tocopherol transfer protein-like [Argiope bruennichi]XP_055943995.1 alpha-tocopherol transfer protein-like [Argiope bruennichi]XP_055943996.1 alpha-tocopherol transfer protein-like [Argiope bruennichi]XP_055943997.1 alpha-tocopherol transfer protein-like [Argiope bruennichi]XP_055943998.1 alpha-tocopherol transfer protein-like [Argiope bruennichi]
MAACLESLEFNDVEIDDARLNRNKTHYREVPGIKTRSLNELKSMLGKNTGFRPCIDDNFLLRFLTAAKYLPDETLKRLKTYYIGRNLHPQIFRNYLPSNTLSAQALDHIKALPYRAKNLSAVVIIKLGKVDFQKVPFVELLRLELMVFETLMQNSVTQLCGITVIIDCDGFSPDNISEIMPCLPTCYSVFHYDCTLGIRYLHVIKTPVLLQLLYQNVISAWSREQQTQVVFHSPDSDLEELHNQVSIDYLPEEYGGKLSSSSLVDLNPIINEKESYFREQLQYGISNDELELD